MTNNIMIYHNNIITVMENENDLSKQYWKSMFEVSGEQQDNTRKVLGITGKEAGKY